MEVLVSVIVFSIAIVFLYQMLFSGRMQVEFEGERRVASKAAELKIEELKYAGYGSSDAAADWTSLTMDIGTHPGENGRQGLVEQRRRRHRHHIGPGRIVLSSR